MHDAIRSSTQHEQVSGQALGQLLPFPPDVFFPSATVCDRCDHDCSSVRSRALRWVPNPEPLPPETEE